MPRIMFILNIILTTSQIDCVKVKMLCLHLTLVPRIPIMGSVKIKIAAVEYFPLQFPLPLLFRPAPSFLKNKTKQNIRAAGLPPKRKS